MNDTINFTTETALEFRTAYKQALADGRQVFTFQGKEVLTAYAKYVCEYLVMQKLLAKE